MSAFAGTGRLVRLAIRRDRVRIPVWIVAITLFSVIVAPAFAGLYDSAEARQQAAATLDSPAGLAMSGPGRYLEDYHYGAMMGHQMLGYTAVLAAIMSILLIVRHTRSEEEAGLAELVRSSVVGRHAHLTAALVVVLVANLGVAVGHWIGLGSTGLDGITWTGSLLYGLAHAVTGMTFAGVAAVTVQISEHPRGASGLAFAALGAAFMLRAMGDAGSGALTWLSPIGWSQLTYVYVDDRWWPLLLPIVFGLLLVTAAFALSRRRDVGAGLRAPSPGRATASPALLTPFGFAVRLHRGLMIGFAVGMFILGAGYGSIITEVDEMLGGIEMIEEAMANMAGTTLVESFASFVMIVMAVLASVYAVMAANRARSEESSGRAESVLTAGLSQPGWLGAHLLVAAIGGAVVMLSAGLGFGLTAGAVGGDWDFGFRVIGASLAYVPAVWFASALAALLFGYIPGAAVLAWIVPLYGFVVGYLGQIAQFPDWMQSFSPFNHVPALPGAELEWLPLLILAVLAVGLAVLGIAGFRNRDLMSTT